MAYKCPFCPLAFSFSSEHRVFNEVVKRFMQGNSIEYIGEEKIRGEFGIGATEVEKILREELQHLHNRQSHKAFWKEKDGK